MYDKRWKMYLLPYHKTHINSQEDKDRHQIFLFDCLGVEPKNCELRYKTETAIEKQSLSDSLNKTYIHRFTEAKIHFTNNKFFRKSFKFNGRKYRWFSIDDMKFNQKMQEHNKDVIDVLSELYG